MNQVRAAWEVYSSEMAGCTTRDSGEVARKMEGHERAVCGNTDVASRMWQEGCGEKDVARRL